MNGAPAIVGVDFSGARDAGRHLWIASGRPEAGRFVLESLRRGDDLPGSGAAREPALRALVEHVAGSGHAVVGLDFPFSLAERLLPGADWRRDVLPWVASFDDPVEFREHLRRRFPGGEPKRACDRDARTPFAPHNLRLFRQTWAGLTLVVAPLVDADRARVVPFQTPRPGAPVLAEICPASLLRARRLPAVEYKGRTDAHRARRAELLQAVVSHGLLVPPAPAFGALAIADPGGDALDAVLAACAALGAWSSGSLERAPSALERAEGRVYF